MAEGTRSFLGGPWWHTQWAETSPKPDKKKSKPKQFTTPWTNPARRNQDRSVGVLPGGPTNKFRQRLQSRGQFAVPSTVVDFKEANPQQDYAKRLFGLPNAIDLGIHRDPTGYDPFKILKEQYIGSGLGNEFREMQGLPLAQEGRAGLSGIPGEIIDFIQGSSAESDVEEGRARAPGSIRKGRKQIGKELHKTIKGLMERGMGHKEAQNALSSILQTSEPTLDPDQIMSATPEGQLQMAVNDPVFQMNNMLQNEILPPLLNEIDIKKGLLDQLVQWEESGGSGRGPLYGWSDHLDDSYGTYTSGKLAAEIAFDETNLEQKAMEDFITSQKAEERAGDILELAMSTVNSGQAPSPGMMADNGQPFPMLSSLILATLMGGRLTKKPGSSSGVNIQDIARQLRVNPKDLP